MDLWTNVRGTFVDRLDELVKQEGLMEGRGVGQKSGEWLSVKCPLCTDSGGSASIALNSGHLMCRQCGANEPLFDWMAKKHGHTSPWDACKAMAEQLGIDMPKRSRAKQVKLSKETLGRMVADLWDTEGARLLREELIRRKFSQSELQHFYLGFDGRGVIFPRISVEGDVADRAHRWHGPRAKAKWTWTKAATPGQDANYYWPEHLPPRDNTTIVLVEGEMDCLVGRTKLQWPEHEFFSWTGGVTSGPRPGQVPEWLRGRTVLMIADNDTWQGPGNRLWAPTDKKEQEARVRRKRLLDHARTLSRFDNKVRLLRIPIPPEKEWGADLRDWWEQGGREIEDLPVTTLREALDEPVDYQQVPAAKVFQMPGKRVQFEVRVAGLDVHRQLWAPNTTVLDCEMGAYKCCGQCRAPDEFPEGMIVWSETPELQRMLHRCLASRDANKSIEQFVVGRPKGCPSLLLQHDEARGRPVYLWHGEADGIAPGNELKVIGPQAPVAHEPCEVEGEVNLELAGPSAFVIAERVKESKTARIDIRPYLEELREIAPWNSDDSARVERFLEERWWDLCTHVTKISNPRLAMIYDLTAHSARRYHYNGKLTRGWLDTCLIGVTRCGKSETAATLHEHFGGAGERASTQSNFTAAGLVAGNVRTRDGGYRIAPGAFPRNHRKMLVLDEAHLMRDHRKGTGGNMLDQLQEIRDRGIADSMKVAGHYKLPAEVRLLCVANPPRGTLKAYHHKCEAFQDIYVNPEMMARMDFGLIVDEDEALEARDSGFPQIPHQWTRELCVTLRQRAWDMDPEDVAFADGVEQSVKDVIAHWEHVYDPEFPLFTGADKVVSVLRLAISIANICFSHEKGTPNKCLVRKVHARKAVSIMEDLWESSGYLTMSTQRKVGVTQPLVAEYGLIQNLPNADAALNLLPHCFGAKLKSEIQTLYGLAYHQSDKWISKMMSTGALTVQRTRGGTYYALTHGGNELIGAVLGLANDDPNRYRERFLQLSQWHNGEFLSHPTGLKPTIDPLISDEEPPF